MNQIVVQSAPSAGLVPASMGEAFQLAEMMASAKLVPAALQKSPADCLMVIQQAIRWQMDPFAVAQECSVIQGKLMHSGKLVAAVVNSRGNLAERLSFDYRGEGDQRVIVVNGRLSGEKAVRSVEVRLRDARTSNKVWQSQPDQQLMYHGVRVWARRHTPELMLGVYSPEEFDEAPPAAVIAPPAPVPARPAIAVPAKVEAPVHPETGEVGPHQIPVPEKPAGGSDWIRFGQLYIAAVNATTTLAEVEAWATANAPALKTMERDAPKVFERMSGAVNSHRNTLPTTATQDEPSLEDAPF